MNVWKLYIMSQSAAKTLSRNICVRFRDYPEMEYTQVGGSGRVLMLFSYTTNHIRRIHEIYKNKRLWKLRNQ